MKLNDKVYDVLKWVTLILLPAAAALYFGLSKIWGFPNAENVVGTISCIVTFLGTLLGISTAGYKRSMEVEGGEEVDE